MKGKFLECLKKQISAEELDKEYEELISEWEGEFEEDYIITSSNILAIV